MEKGNECWNCERKTKDSFSKLSIPTFSFVLHKNGVIFLIPVQVPGSKSTKYKKERDLVGLAGAQLCLFKAEADVEDEISIANRILRAVPRMTVHTNLQDAHLYIFKKWVCDFLIKDK